MSTETTYPKRLIEVDLPIKRISEHARREKSIRHGHISTLHIWWARRPLAACRAVILAALWPDPADPLCPEGFREEAARRMREWRDARGGPQRNWEKPREVRAALLDFIANFANWDNSNDKDYLETSRALVQVAHESLGGAPGTRPLVVDPFAGGGAIPLEALRVGADAFASDLNPVAVLLNKVVLEYIPKYGQRLADEVRKWGEWVKKEAENELAQFYPKDPDGATPIAYLWARTIRCEGPGCGAEVPMLRSLWLAKKGSRSVALRIVPDAKKKRVEFEIIEGARASDVGEGTVRRGSATCPVCGYTTPNERVRQQLTLSQGGADEARLFAVVTVHPAQPGRFYRKPTASELRSSQSALQELKRVEVLQYAGGVSVVPNERIPPERPSPNARGLSAVTRMGIERFSQLYSARQLLTLVTLSRCVQTIGDRLEKSGCNQELGKAVSTVLALAVDRQADATSSLCRWHTTRELHTGTFGRQALPIVWDFSESSVFSEATGGFSGAVDWIVDVCMNLASAQLVCGQSENATATACPLPDDSAQVLATDPPYYDSIPYADLSDYFYVWLRRCLMHAQPRLFASELTPKDEEAIWNPSRIVSETGRAKDKTFYETQMTKALADAKRVVSSDGIGVVVFAHKSTAGWEAILAALIQAGWTATASWPVDTEMGNRVNAMGTASLASSVHIACRPRKSALHLAGGQSIGDWRDVLSELPPRIHDWMPRLAAEGVVGADAIFACLGPALEIFSRYDRVEKASGEQVTLKDYLEHVWAAVEKEALSMIFQGADATGFEEDARLTAMWLWTLSKGEANGNTKAEGDEDAEPTEDDEDAPSGKSTVRGFALEFDAARKIAQGLGVHLDALNSLVEIKGDTARLLAVSERTRALFGKEDASAPSKSRKKKDAQQKLPFAEVLQEAEEEAGWGAKNAPPLGKSILDRVHQSMILFAAGRGDALKRFLIEDAAGRDERFWRLAQALSALYPSSTEEKRWVDGVLARKKGLGF